MKLEVVDPPRKFTVGAAGITLRDCLHIRLEPGDRAVFPFGNGGTLAFERRPWGYALSGALNDGSAQPGLRAVIAGSGPERCHLMLVESGKEDAFRAYGEPDGMRVVAWLDEIAIDPRARADFRAGLRRRFADEFSGYTA